MKSRRPALPQFRLVDGVVLAAIALLALRVLGLVSSAGSPGAPPSEDPPAFARVLSHARTNFEPADPTETGSVPEHGAPEHGATAPAAAPEPKPAPAVPPPPPMPSASERAILQRLGERREELQNRSREVESREKLILDQEKKLDDRIGELKASEEKLQAAGGPGKRADGEAAGLKNIVTMYETMKPKEAARVFDRLPQDVLISVVTQMNPRKMAEVLAVMTPEGAEKLTVALARRAGGAEERVQVSSGALPAGELPAITPPRR